MKIEPVKIETIRKLFKKIPKSKYWKPNEESAYSEMECLIIDMAREYLENTKVWKERKAIWRELEIACRTGQNILNSLRGAYGGKWVWCVLPAHAKCNKYISHEWEFQSIFFDGLKTRSGRNCYVEYTSPDQIK